MRHALPVLVLLPLALGADASAASEPGLQSFTLDNGLTVDHTAFSERIVADRLDLVMAMEANRMVNLAPTEASVLSERDVVIEERRQMVDGEGPATGEIGPPCAAPR